MHLRKSPGARIALGSSKAEDKGKAEVTTERHRYNRRLETGISRYIFRPQINWTSLLGLLTSGLTDPNGWFAFSCRASGLTQVRGESEGAPAEIVRTEADQK